MLNEKFLIRLKHASSVVVLTGAGISKESGLPTFRGKDGIWNDYKAEELATPQSLQKNPELFWQFYTWRIQKVKEAKPNLGHYAIVDMERLFSDFVLITQNVDNLHSVAGNPKIVELHGNIMNSRCTKCEHVIHDAAGQTDEPPRCPKCGSLMRPDVVLFGENLKPGNLRKAQEASSSCEVFFSIGTSGLVEPAASLPFQAKGNGAFIVEINPEQTPLTSFMDESIRVGAGKFLPHLIMIIEKLKAQ